MPHLLISAAHKSSGKTTLSLGLCAALRRQGLKVQAFKKGPDYIDPMWLALASGRDCHNLDFYTQGRDEIRADFARLGADADLSLIEGNKGLYDGLDIDGSNSNAALAQLLRAPVVLVIDVQGMTRGIAPLILGYQQFEPRVHIAGIILNKVGGRRHESKLRAVIGHYTEVPVIGAVAKNEDMAILERHLGLVPSNEAGQALERVERIAALVADQVDLNAVRRIAAIAPRPTRHHLPVTNEPPSPPAELHIGIARDAAFGFYYPGDLDALRQAGAELVFFDTLRDNRLPAVDALFIGGGFPETQMAALEANAGLRQQIRDALAAGLPAYAECGGLMYLARSITWKERHHTMVGAVPADCHMHQRPVGRGYTRLRETTAMPWPVPTAPARAQGTRELAAHEFHYSALTGLPPDSEYGYEVLRGTGIDGHHDGLVIGNLLASYTHLRDVAANHWARRFVAFVHAHKASNAPNRSAEHPSVSTDPEPVL